MLSNSNHSCSLISRTPVQMLVITDDIFVDIFVNQNQNSKLSKKHLQDLLNRKQKLNHYLMSHPNAVLPHVKPHSDSTHSKEDEAISNNKQLNMEDIKVEET